MVSQSFIIIFFILPYHISLQLQDAVVSFPLYTEALKFAHYEEKMIQTAVRALTLNTYNGILLLSFFISSPIRRYISKIGCEINFWHIATLSFWLCSER